MPPSHESDSHSPESPSQIISSQDESSHKSNPSGVTVAPKRDATVEDDDQMSSGRERLKRHRVEVAGRVWIPDMWGQEDLLKDWIDCAAFDASLVNSRIMLARDSLMGEGRRRSPNSTTLRISHGC